MLGEFLETFHFVLNNRVLEDGRIPPFGLDPAEARQRNILSVPEDAFPLLPDGTYRYWDEFTVPARTTSSTTGWTTSMTCGR